MLSAIAEFQSGSEALFQENLGYNGGAIAMYGFSNIVLNSDSTVNFSQNHAINFGGAIYFRTIDQHSLLKGNLNCFFRSGLNEGNLELIKTIKVTFDRNTADLGAASIYSESFDNCYYRCKGILNVTTYKYERDNIFRCFGTFTFNDADKQAAMSTAGRTFKFHYKPPFVYNVIPEDKLFSCH